ncbi:Channel protein, hemolysin III family [Candidatus Phytoplasma mali]|uniref:Channel protein, hemolysin III family n=1 Tax=Phytoplasma mali (strain AT) TaxID=482235 RepID=B3QZW8_PHYMT|nr:hemolysin III family protein [Candidatus Phytoplasma mali]CAP18505.1 Channel protein, hemolysin III family [Candidatus Phytoplasma mali]
MTKRKKENSSQTLGEEIANSISHGLMVPFGIIMLILISSYIYYIWPKLTEIPFFNKVFSIFYPFSIIFLYLTSTLYHSLSFTKAKKIFKKFDHIGIYLLIFGTFTPFLLLSSELNKPLFSEYIITKGLFFFVFQFIITIIGIILKWFWIYKWNKIHICLFLLLGWSSLFIFPYLYKTGNDDYNLVFYLLLSGGFFYSSGVYFYIKDYKKYYHFIWHLFVLSGTICHFIAIMFFLHFISKS